MLDICYILEYINSNLLITFNFLITFKNDPLFGRVLSCQASEKGLGRKWRHFGYNPGVFQL